MKNKITMETKESIKIIEQMLMESRQSLSNFAFYFILWAVLLIPCGVIEWYFFDYEYKWICWPIAGVLGGIIAMIYGSRQSRSETVKTTASRLIGFIWGGFGICLVISIFYTVNLHIQPHTMILLLAGGATFTTGGLSKFKPLVFGGIFLILAAVVSGFIVALEIQSLVFSVGLLGGYLIPGLMLRKIENG